MAKSYSPKKIDLIYEVVELSEEELQQRLDDAFDILFEETLRFLKINGRTNLNDYKENY